MNLVIGAKPLHQLENCWKGTVFLEYAMNENKRDEEDDTDDLHGGFSFG